MPRGEPQKKLVYGVLWPIASDPVHIERECIRNGGRWQLKNGDWAGEGNFFHYKRFQQLVWPEDAHHRWSDLTLQEILNNRITSIMGAKDTGKTHCALAKFSLTDYFCFPQETLVMITSTDIRGLELRVWGDLKNLFQRAKDRVPWLPGHLIDSKHAIATDNLQFGEARDMRKGIICLPCMTAGGGWIGIAKMVGLKQKRRRLLSDELQFMKPSFLESLANLNSGDFKGVFVGNPIGEGDPLDKVSEPKEGWGTEGEITKTSTWDNKFIGGRTINLVGTDSPNFDQSQDPEPKYPYLINQKSIDNVVAFYGKDSLQYYSQCLGIRKPGLNARRVISKQLCKKFGAFDEAMWLDTRQTDVYAVDAAYGGVGGDRCAGIRVSFGKDVQNKLVMKVYDPDIIPVTVNPEKSSEDQISEFVKLKCESNGIPAEHVFFDSTGRGSLGTSFARIWSAYVNPVEFGGKATVRPVSSNLYIYDEVEKQKRLKRCDEHYSKLVTEFWFTTRYIIESGQMRGLPESVMDEGCRREWKMVRGDKIEVETKAEMKERVNISPDLYDAFVTACEGARRLGFVIQKLEPAEAPAADEGWKNILRDRAKKLRQSHELVYTA
jgi:hypothetical protein